MALKTFASGDVFGGDDMNALVGVSNMRFPDAATRAATLTGKLAPSNGSTSHLTSDQHPYRYNGTAWVPQPGLMIVNCWSTWAQSVPFALVTPVTAFNNGTVDRNENGWFAPATGKFLPAAAGYYEFCFGGVFYHGATEYTGSRVLGLTLNSTSAWIPHSQTTGTCCGIGSTITYWHMKPTAQYLNGTTDYVYPAASQTAGSGISLGMGSGNAYPNYFSVKFLGA